MTEPRTEAGRALLANLDRIGRTSQDTSFPMALDDILSIEAEAAALAATPPPLDPTRRAIAQWLVQPTRSYHGDEAGTVYGYDVAMAEVRSILRDPTGENTTGDPSPEEVEAAATPTGDET